MIYVTGDTHIPVDIQKLSTKRFPAQKELTKDDYVIICGDFGGVWDVDRFKVQESPEEKNALDWLESKPFTTLFVPGNHENYDRLGLEEQYMEILGVQVPMNTIPITPGRNLAVILEVAAMNNRQRKMGYNPALEFTQQIDRHFAQEMEG